MNDRGGWGDARLEAVVLERALLGKEENEREEPPDARDPEAEGQVQRQSRGEQALRDEPYVPVDLHPRSFGFVVQVMKWRSSPACGW